MQLDRSFNILTEYLFFPVKVSILKRLSRWIVLLFFTFAQQREYANGLMDFLCCRAKLLRIKLEVLLVTV